MVLNNQVKQLATNFLVGDNPNGVMQYLEEKVALARHFANAHRVRTHFMIKSLTPKMGCNLKVAMHIFIDLDCYGKAGQYYADSPMVDEKETDLNAGFKFKNDFPVKEFFSAVLSVVGE